MAKIEYWDADDKENARWYFPCKGCRMGHALPVKPHAKGWEFNGNVESPTFHPSVLSRFDYNEHGKPQGICHFFVTDGKIKYLADCTHGLAGQTVEMEDILDG